MLNPAEKRFIKSWEEQRKGGKAAYYLLYVTGGTFVISILTFIVLLFFMQVHVTPMMLWVVPLSAFTLAGLLTSRNWQRSENRFKKIIRREVTAGRQQDDRLSMQ